MGQRMIDFLALLIQHHIGEVIIFINDKIKMRSGFSRMKIQIIQFTYKIGLCFHLLSKSRKIIRFVGHTEQIHDHTAVTVEVLGQRTTTTAGTGKVKKEYLESPLQPCRATAYP